MATKKTESRRKSASAHKTTDFVRCSWAGADPVMQAYHDKEWGVPEHNSRKLFEKLLLDGFQAGLSWRTILHRRAGLRAAFDRFEPAKMAKYSDKKLVLLKQDERIIRHAGKILAARTNAQAYLKLVAQKGAFSKWLWQFAAQEAVRTSPLAHSAVPTQTAASVSMSKALKSCGFSFCGPTICYAFMQAVGMVNDHTEECFRAPRINGR